MCSFRLQVFIIHVELKKNCKYFAARDTRKLLQEIKKKQDCFIHVFTLLSGSRSSSVLCLNAESSLVFLNFKPKRFVSMCYQGALAPPFLSRLAFAHLSGKPDQLIRFTYTLRTVLRSSLRGKEVTAESGFLWLCCLV